MYPPLSSEMISAQLQLHMASLREVIVQYAVSPFQLKRFLHICHCTWPLLLKCAQRGTFPWFPLIFAAQMARPFCSTV